MQDWYTDCLECCWCYAIPGCSTVSQLRRLSINRISSILDVWLRLGSIKFSDPLFHDIVSIVHEPDGILVPKLELKKTLVLVLRGAQTMIKNVSWTFQFGHLSPL